MLPARYASLFNKELLLLSASWFCFYFGCNTTFLHVEEYYRLHDVLIYDFPADKFIKGGFLLGSLLAGIIVDRLRNQKWRLLLGFIFIFGNFLILILIITLDYEETRVDILLLLVGSFEYGSVTLFYLYILDMARAYE